MAALCYVARLENCFPFKIWDFQHEASTKCSDINTSETHQVADGEEEKHSHSTQPPLSPAAAAANTIHGNKRAHLTRSSQWNVWNSFYCLSLGRIPPSSISLGSGSHTQIHSFMQSPANKTFLPEVVKLITGIVILFSQPENKKFSAALQALTKSLLTNWKHLFKHNYSKLSNQFNSTLKTAAKCHLFCMSKPFNLLSLSIFQGLFILTRFHIFPLVYFLVSSNWMPEAYAPQIQLPSLLHCQVDHKHQSWKIKPMGKLTCPEDTHQKPTRLHTCVSMNPQSYTET